MLQPFPNVIQGVEDHPVLGEGTHQVPVPHPTQAVFRDQTQLGPDAAGILEPDLVLLSPLVHVPEPGGLDRLVEPDGSIVAGGQGDGVLVGDCLLYTSPSPRD